MSKRHWPFILAVAVQTLIVIGVPARRGYTLLTGRTVVLKTAPVDPYDILSGYYVILSYDISRPPGGLPGDQNIKEGQKVYVVLEEGDDGFWHAKSASAERPRGVSPEAVVIKGVRRSWQITYGIEKYFIPEGMGGEIERGLRGAREKTRVEVKVDHLGHAALVRLHVGGKTYDY